MVLPDAPRLAGADYQTVSDAFAGFQTSTEALLRGRYQMGGKGTFYDRTSPLKVTGIGTVSPTDTYHRRTSFSQEQIPYVATSFKCFADLLRGESHTLTSTGVRSFSDLVVQDLDLQRYPPYFGSSISKVTLAKILEFQEVYPNLMPAFHCAMSEAGVAGLKTVMDRSLRQVSSLLRGEEEMVSGANARSHFPRNVFVGVHTVSPDGGKSKGQPEYEVWCTGVGVAEAFMDGVLIAAQKTVEKYGANAGQIHTGYRAADEWDPRQLRLAVDFAMDKTYREINKTAMEI